MMGLDNVTQNDHLLMSENAQILATMSNSLNQVHQDQFLGTLGSVSASLNNQKHQSQILAEKRGSII